MSNGGPQALKKGEETRTYRWKTLREDSGWWMPEEADAAIGLNPGAWQTLEEWKGCHFSPAAEQTARDLEKRLDVNHGWLNGTFPYSRVIKKGKPGRGASGRSVGHNYIDAHEAQAHFATARYQYNYAMGEGEARGGPLGEFLNCGSNTVLRKLLNEDPDDILIEEQFAKAILSIPHSHTRRIPSAIGAQRRLQGLVAFGYTPAYLRNRLKVHRVILERTLYGRGVVPLGVKTGQNLTELHALLEHVPGPSTDARRLAEKHGWALPFCWDEDTVDREWAKPSEVRDKNDIPAEIEPSKRNKIVEAELSRYWKEEA